MRGILTRRPGVHVIILSTGKNAAGKYTQSWQTFYGTKREAELKRAELLTALRNGTFFRPHKGTLADFLQHWLEDTVRSRVGAKTFERYKEIVDYHISPALGHYPLSKLTPSAIQSAYNRWLTSGSEKRKAGLSSQTVLHHHRLLHSALKKAVKMGHLSRNPCDGVDPPRVERKEMRVLDGPGLAGLLAKVSGTELHMPVFLALGLGLRRGEVCAMKWSDLDEKRSLAVISRSVQQIRSGVSLKGPKNRAGRALAVPKSLMRALMLEKRRQETLRKDFEGFNSGGYVCVRGDGSMWHPDSLTDAFRHRVSEIRFHDLRHSHATQLFALGVHPKIVSERLGHRTVKLTLDTYSHVLPHMQDKAAKLFDRSLQIRSSKPKKRRKT